MDPNATLEEIRSLIICQRQDGLSESVRCTRHDVDQIARFFGLVEELDRWLARGGFRPVAWNVREAHIHPVSGKLEELRTIEDVFDYLELLGSGNAQERAKIRSLLTANPKAEGLVIYRCLQMDSSNLGARSTVLVGPGCTCETIEKAAQQHLYDLPSQRQYPCAYYQRGSQ